MDYLVLLGSILLLILLIYNKLNIVIAAFISILSLFFYYNFSYTKILEENFIYDIAKFVKDYFLLFVSGAVFGKIMEDSACTSSISKYIIRKFGAKNSVYGAMLTTGVLTYFGISVFVIVYAVLPIFLYTFKKSNLPQKLIPSMIMCSSCSFALAMFPGSVQLNNIIPSRYLGTTLYAAPILGIISGILSILIIVVYYEYLIKQFRKNNIGFNTNPEFDKQIKEFENSNEINIFLAIIPLIGLIVSLMVLNLDIFYSMIVGSLLAFIIGGKNIKNKFKSLNEGVSRSFPAIITTAAAVGFGSVIRAMPAFKSILSKLLNLPFNPYFNLSIATTIIAGITGSGGGGTEVACSILIDNFSNIGLNPQYIHRIIVISALGLSCLPHNGMVNTLFMVCKVDYSEGYKYVLISQVLQSIVVMLIAVFLTNIIS